MKHVILLLLLLFFGSMEIAHGQVLDPNDPVITYDPDNPPSTPPFGTLAKWVRTRRLNWNTDNFKAYYFNGMVFRLRFPNNYDPSGNTKYPLIVMLPGRGESGTIYDNENNLKHAAQDHERAINDGDYNGFLFFPQSTNGYWGEGYRSIINTLINNYFPAVHVDRDRVIIHGLSSGGQGTWEFISEYPNTIAAALPMSASSTAYYNGINRYKHLPLWVSQGGQDTAPTPFTTSNLVDEIVNSGGNIRYTLYKNLGHGVWNTHYNESDFWPYINRAHKTVPVVMNGELTLVSTSTSRDVYEFLTKEELCPGENIQVRLGLTAGFQAYQWRRNGSVISGATSNEYVATQYGVYDARFMRNGEWSQWSERAIEVKEKPATVTPDIQLSALASHVLPSPDGKTTVDLELPEGYVAYGWKRNNTNTILSTNRVFSAGPGEYVATVTEQFGCSSSFSNPFEVIDANGNNAPPALSSAAGFALSKTSVQLQWAKVPNATYPATSFELYRTTSSGTDYSLISILDPNTSQYTDNNLQANTNYYYIIRPVNQNGAAPVSEEISVKTEVDNNPPTAPLNLVATSTSPTQIKLAWDEATDDVGVYRYDVYRNGVKSVVAETNSATIFNLQEGQIYRFQVKARDLTGNESPFSNQLVIAAVSSGLTYKYYEGQWSNLPDFNALTPVKTGISDNVDISVRERNDNFGFIWEGLINIPVAGTYTFETNSDDGSKLYISNSGSAYNESNLVVNNDGLHGNQYRSGNYTFNNPGSYPIAITFFERGGGENMQVFWRRPGQNSREAIPSTAFKDEVSFPQPPPAFPTQIVATAASYNEVDVSWTDNSNNENSFQIYRSEYAAGPFLPVGMTNANVTTFHDTKLKSETTYYYRVMALNNYGDSGFSDEVSSGLNYFYYESSFSSLDQLNNATPRKEGILTNFSLSPRDRNNNIAFKYVGKINLPTSGQYTFYTESDDGSNLFINGVRIVNNDYNQGMTERNGNINLTAGVHDIEVRWRQGSGGYGLNVRYAGPGINKQLVPDAALRGEDVKATTLPLPPAPNAPVNPLAEAISLSEINLSWSRVNNAEGYTIYRSIDNDQNFLPVAEVNGAGSTSTIVYNDEDLYPHTNYYYQIEAYNVGGKAISAAVSVSTLNTSPVLDDIQDLTIRFGETFDLQLYGSDGDGDALTISANNLPSFATLTDYGDGSGLLRFDPTQTDQGTYSGLIVRLSDGFGGQSSSTFNLQVNNNFLPTLSAISNVVMEEGSEQIISITANDAEGVENLTWGTEGLPSFANFVSNVDGSATITLNPTYSDGGLYEGIRVSVTDQSGASVNQTFDIEVTEIDPKETVLVNFRQNTNAPSPWNNIGSLGVHALQNTNGEASGISLELQTTSWNTFTQGAQTGNNSGVFPDAVLRDYYYFGIFSAPATVTIKVSGLSVDGKYNFAFLSSSVWTGTADNGTTVYTIGSESASVYAQGNTQNTANFTGISPNAQGEVLITMSKGANTPAGYLNGFKLESVVGIDDIPAAPRSLTASIEGSSLRLNWVDAPYNEDGFRIYRSETPDGPFTQVNSAVLPSGTQTYLDATISEGVEYYYAVSAYNENGESPYSNVVEVSVPNTPPTITVSGSQTLFANQVSVIDFSVTDPPLNEFTISVTNLPTFASYSESEGEGSITFSPTIDDVGSYTVLIEAQDSQGESNSTTLNIIVQEELLYSVSLNFSRNFNVPSPWNNTAKDPVNGDTFSNLLDANGNNSGVSVRLQTSFGGLFNEGAQTGNNTGIVPDNALREYYYFGIFGAPNQVSMRVSGLDNNNKYKFKFVGSSVWSGAGDNGETNYTIGNKTVSLDVQGNTQNAAEITDVTADANGNVFITMTKGSGASAGYINALIIEAYNGDSQIFNPSDLVANALSENTIELKWTDNSFDETGFEIYRSTDGINGNYSLIYTTGANQTSYSNTGLAAGTNYYYKVRAIIPGGYSEYTNTAIGGTISYYVYINVNGVPAYDQDVPWNNLSALGQTGDIFTGFKNNFGNEIGMALEVIHGMQGSNDWGTSTGDDSGVYPDNVMKSFYFNDAFDPKGEFILQGLDLSFNYNLKFFGAIETGFNIVTNFTAGGITVSNNQTNNISEVAGIYGISPSENGEIKFDVQEASGSRWAIFNALVLEAYPKENNINARKENSKKVYIEGDYIVKFGLGESENGILNLSYYPNPIEDYLTIVVENVLDGNAIISINDLHGRELSRAEYFLEKDYNEIHLDSEIKSLKAGLYVVGVQINDEHHYFKIVIP